MTSEEDLGVDFVVRERHLALKQARGQVVIQACMLVIFVASVALWAALDSPQMVASTVGAIAVGAVATAYDVRWWLWLRRADPHEAYRRLQARDDHEGGAFRSRLPLLVTVGVFALWWFVGR